MRIVLTGGAGFLGSHLADRLLAENHEVIVIDNLSTGHVSNIAHIKEPRFEFIHYDVTNYLYIDGPVDFVLHFASPASPADYMQMPIQTLKVGSLGTHKALGLAKAKGAGFLLASTSEVYGDPLVNPQPEDYWGNVNPVGPRGVYDEAKRFSEALAMAYHRYHGVDTRIARIFNTFGPRMRSDDGRLVPTLINQALRGEPLTVFGDGLQTRSLCYISDQVEGLYRLILSKEIEPVNIGNSDEMTVNEIAEMIRDIVGTDTPIVHQSLPEDDPKVRRPDVTKAREVLGWEPKISIEEGLKKTVEWFRQKVQMARIRQTETAK
ncbi:MAG: UDP-glucuronic acid decarboxylase family protein [bacterium]